MLHIKTVIPETAIRRNYVVYKDMKIGSVRIQDVSSVGFLIGRPCSRMWIARSRLSRIVTNLGLIYSDSARFPRA